MRRVSVTIAGGSGTTAYSTPIPLDINIAAFNVAFQISNVSGKPSVTIQATLDDPYVTNWDASAANWTTNSTIGTISAAALGFYTGQPIAAIRAVENSTGSGGATLTVIQGEAT